MSVKETQLKEINEKNGYKAAGLITPEAYFRWIGLKPMSQQQVWREINKQVKPGVIRRLQEAFLNNDGTELYKVLSSNYNLLQLLHCGNFYSLCAKARLFERMPIRMGANLLDFQMDDAGPIGFWRAEHRNCHVTSVSTYWQTGVQWAQEISERRVTFTNNNPKGLYEGAKGPYDSVILSPGWEHYFDGILNKVYVPAQRDLLDPEKTSMRLVEFFGLLAELVVSKGILILEHNSLPPYKVGLLANEMDVFGVYPHWKLVMALSPVNDQDLHSALIFSRESIPTFVHEAFTALTEKGQVAPGSGYFGESAQLFRQFFRDGELMAMWEYEWLTNKVKSKTEFLRKGGIGLLYKSSSAGGHMAQLMPEGQLSAQAKQLKNHLKEKEDKGSIKIINKFPA
jgi:hypothetical protein